MVGLVVVLCVHLIRYARLLRMHGLSGWMCGFIMLRLSIMCCCALLKPCQHVMVDTASCFVDEGYGVLARNLSGNDDLLRLGILLKEQLWLTPNGIIV